MPIKFYKICPECNFFCRMEEEDRFCSYCGSELLKSCAACGKPIDNPYATCCKYCGSKYRTDKREYNF